MKTTDHHCDREDRVPADGLMLSDEDFDALVEAQVSTLPKPMLAQLDNVAIFVEDIDPEAGMELLGVYEGVDAPSRGEYGFGELPDRIVLFKLPLLAISRSMEELRHQIHVTLVHEIAHFYGLDDDELHRLGWA